MVLPTIALGFAAGALRELYEWFANNVLGASIQGELPSTKPRTPESNEQLYFID